MTHHYIFNACSLRGVEVFVSSYSALLSFPMDNIDIYYCFFFCKIHFGIDNKVSLFWNRQGIGSEFLSLMISPHIASPPFLLRSFTIPVCHGI